MIVDIFNEVFTKLKTELVNASVETDFNTNSTNYPIVTIAEKGNTDDPSTKDSSGYTYNIQMYQIDIFTIGDLKVSTAKELRNQIDDIMSGEYGMQRTYGDATPNFLDKSIYRYTLRYDFLIDKETTIYGR